MSAQDVRDRLGDRFRLLSGSRRGLGTPSDAAPRRAVVLRPARRRRTGGAGPLFGVRRRLRPRRRRPRLRRRAATSTRCLDLLDSLVRKSLVTVEQVGRPRPLRDAGDDPPVRRGPTRRHRHDRRGPGSSRPLLRRAGRRPLGHLGRAPPTRRRSTGSTPSSPTCGPGSAGPPTRATSSPPPPSPRTPPCWRCALQRFEPVGWAEEILAAATAADLRSTPPPLHRRQSLLVHRAALEDGRRLRPDRGRRWRPIPATTPSKPGGAACGRPAPTSYAGRIDRYLEICAAPGRRSPGSRTSSVCADCSMHLPPVGRAEEAMAIADETVAAARAHGNPFWIAWALVGVRAGLRRGRPGPGSGRPASGPRLRRRAPTPVSGRRLIARDAAGLEAVHGELEQALPCSTPPSTPSTAPATSPTWPPPSPTSPCSSTASNDPRSPPPSTAPAPATASPPGHQPSALSWTTCAPCSARPPSTRRRRRGRHGTRRSRALRPPPDPTRPRPRAWRPLGPTAPPSTTDNETPNPWTSNGP